MFKKIVASFCLGTMYVLSSLGCKEPPMNYNLRIATAARNYGVVESKVSEEERKKLFEIEAEKIRKIAMDYQINKIKFLKSNSYKEKKEIEKILREQESSLETHLSKYEYGVAVIMAIKENNGNEKSKGTSYELNFVCGVTLEDISKVFVEGEDDVLHDKYSPLVILQPYFKKYEDSDPIEKFAYKIELSEHAKEKFCNLVKSKKGLLSYEEITPELIKEWTDNKIENGEISKLGFEVYIAKERTVKIEKNKERRTSKWPQDVSDKTDKIDNKTNFKSSLPRNNAKRSQWPQNVEE